MRWLAILLALWLGSLALAQARIEIGFAEVASSSVIGGNPIEIRIGLLTPAPTSGQLPVTSNRPDLCQTLPIPVQVGQSQVRFLVATRPVDTLTPVVISVGEYGNIRDLQVQLQPDAPAVTQLRMPPRLIGGDSSTVVIVLDRPSSKTARLSLEANENVTIASPLTIPAGVRQFEAPFSTKAVRQSGTARLTYRGARPLVAESQLLPPVEVSGVQVSPDQVEGGQSCNGMVTLTAPAGAPARVKLFAPAHLRVPAEVTVAEGASSANFTVTSATTRTAQTGALEASTPLGRKSAALTVNPTSSLFAAEAARYYLMVSAKDGWLEVPDPAVAGKKWRVKPNGAPKLGPLEPFGYTATVAADGAPEGDSAQHSLVLQLQIAGAKVDWRVSEIKIVRVDVLK